MQKFTHIFRCISVKYWVQRIKFRVSEDIYNCKQARMKLERRGGGGEGEWYGHPGRQCPRGGKINILNKNIDFFALNKF